MLDKRHPRFFYESGWLFEPKSMNMNESVSEGKWMEVKMKKMLLGFEPRVRSKVLFCGYSEGSQVKTFRVRHVPVHAFLIKEGQNNRTFI